jgi:hypothetical protein
MEHDNSSDKIESTSPKVSYIRFAPNEFRNMMQRQSGYTAEREVDKAVMFTIGKSNGRFLSSFPGIFAARENDDGFQFHMVGVSRGGDLSVAAP